MRRREFITAISGAAATWPVAARAQQAAIPVIGFLSFRSANESEASVAAFREGLSEIGYADGRSVNIAFRWADGHIDRVPAMAATKTIPVVFTYGADPVRDGIVASLKQPKDNITGITWFGSDLAGKRVALLHDLVPTTATMALLVNPSDPEGQPEPSDAQDAARRLNLKLV